MVSVMNVRNVKDTARQAFPDWRELGKIRKVDDTGNITGTFAYGGETVAISPRKGAVRCRVRPVRPLVFFAQFCYEEGILPTPFTPEECAQEEFQEILASLWQENAYRLPDLESPRAVCDSITKPDLKTGYSFTIMRALVHSSGTSQKTVSNGHGSTRPTDLANSAMMKRIESIRAGVKQAAIDMAKKKS